MKVMKRSALQVALLLAALPLSGWPLAKPAGAQVPAAGPVVEAAFQAILANPKLIKAL